ncbi:MAG: hypothetical protein KKG25_07395 [Bacteroidetes bacterium]|nr:hypothetical protein [Bacteroidota bacterium]MBU1484664.1 hypothetical protein [Bacteroidota bacterium]MBU1759361.1 hypothetical protein [Bacteroidota bacterium]MBU2377440.1 hypothetical protein [Bacteroidota bacterium]
MDLKEIWKATEASSEKLPEINSIDQLNSKGLKNPLKKAKRMLGKNIIYSVVIGLLYIPILFIYQYWQIQLFLGITLIFTAWAGYSGFKLYQTIEPNVTANNLLSELKRVVYTLEEWIKIQCKVALFIYPVSVAGGYFLGGVIGSGKTVDEFMNRPFVVYALIITIIILTPISYYLSKWMFKYLFGNTIKQMKKLIDELTETNN